MRRSVNIAGVLLGLLALGVLTVVLVLTFGGPWGGAASTPLALRSPIPSPTSPAYPPPGTAARQPDSTVPPPATPTPPRPPYPPPGTRPPKPTPAPTLIPTATPVPTALPLPPSAFYVLWVENSPEGRGQPWGALWLADPRDIAGRREVVRVEKQEIIEAVLSPDGQQVAFETTAWKQPSSLWVVNLDGTGLRQLAPDAGQVFWSRDGRALYYDLGESSETEVKEQVKGWVGIERVDLASGKRQRILTIDFLTSGTPPYLQLLGWSADGQWLYHLRPAQGGCELWGVDQEGRVSQFATFPATESSLRPLLSPDGSKLIIDTPEGPGWISTDGQKRANLPVLSWNNQLCGFLWSPVEDELIICQVDDQRPVEHIRAVNVQTGGSLELGSLALRPDGKSFGLLSISSDRQWMAASVYLDGLYWIHLPTGAIIPVPVQDTWASFTAWVPSKAVGW